MKRFFCYLIYFLFIIQLTEKISAEDKKMKNSIYDIVVKDIDGKEVSLSEFKGKVLLIVNVASKCGFTPQYEGLQKIYEKYRDKGFEILAFPCNDFGNQEPGTNEEIKEFCSTNYNVTFKLFDKIKILGNDKSELYKRLTNSDNVEKGEVKWNFEKFLIDKEGNIISRFRSKVDPESKELTNEIEKLLNK
ncbi:glutathione peroxidase [Rosettibacter firmus]|uniref:glutathione peroxidase n=1 Tax=Rosettibacter firmus TaxID=3111522 RepID=UPI00336C1F5D